MLAKVAKILLLAIGTFALLAIAPESSQAQYRRGYSYSNNYYQPSYSGPTYSAWSYWEYPATKYYYKVRYRYEGSARYLENDGWLYSLNDGHYNQYAKIADYLAKGALVIKSDHCDVPEIGKTVYGTDAFRYAVARHYGPKLASLLQQQGVPNFVDVASLLPPSTTEARARQENSFKLAASATANVAQVALAEQENERINAQARRDAALLALQFNSLERVLGKFTEGAAIALQNATVSATAAVVQIQVPDPTLAQIISLSCFNCHGGAKVEGGIDFRQAAQFDAETWDRIRFQTARGLMPRGGQPLDRNQLKFFDDQYDRVRASQNSVAN